MEFLVLKPCCFTLQQIQQNQRCLPDKVNPDWCKFLAGPSGVFPGHEGPLVVGVAGTDFVILMTS